MMRGIFDNTETSLALKSNSELTKALFLFKIIQWPQLVKIGTALTKLALNTNLPFEKLIRSTVFEHFCGGIDENDCLKVITKMYTKNVHTVLDFSCERKQEEKQFEEIERRIYKSLHFARFHKAIPFVVFKPTAIGKFEIFQKITEAGILDELEKIEWLGIQDRFDRICRKAYDYKVPVLIDAEESWMQEAADQLIEDMMEKYNKREVIVYTTVQAYRWDRLEYVKHLIQKSWDRDFKIGLKLVRGAYMEKERARAGKMGYQDPICVNKKATDNLYNSILNYTFNHLQSINLFVGTHNEESSYFLMDLMKEKKISKNDHRVWFSQLYGMSDHISFNLSEEGYNVAKYLPYGPVKNVIPYLFRRAVENTSVAGQTSRELFLIRKEINRRKHLRSTKVKSKDF